MERGELRFTTCFNLSKQMSNSIRVHDNNNNNTNNQKENLFANNNDVHQKQTESNSAGLFDIRYALESDTMRDEYRSIVADQSNTVGT